MYFVEFFQLRMNKTSDLFIEHLPTSKAVTCIDIYNVINILE